MVKYKYLTLTKEEQKIKRDEFYKTNIGKNLKPRFKRLVIYGTILFIFGLVILIEAIVKEENISYYIYSVILMILGIIFIISKHMLMVRKVNDYIVKNKNKKKN